MSYTPAEWSQILGANQSVNSDSKLLGTNFPSTYSSALRTIRDASANLQEFITKVDATMSTVEGFLEVYVDPIVPTMKLFKKNIQTIFEDVLSIGGAAIVITPWNRVNKREISYRAITTNISFEKLHLSKDATHSFDLNVPPISIPAMTPAEAFVEFKNSFTNTADPFRPRWTTNVKTTGWGLLATCAEPSDLITAISALQSFFNFDDFKKIWTEYKKKVDTYAKDLNESQYNAIATNIRGQGLLLEGYEEYYQPVGPGLPPQRRLRPATKITLQTNLPELHWYGLSVENLPGLRAAVESIYALLDWLIKISEDATSAIRELFEAIKKKIYGFLNQIQTVLNALDALLAALSVSNLYYFSIPAEFGGIDHIVESFQSSIQNPPNAAAAGLAKAWTTNPYSILFFAGVGGEINTDAWSRMFGEMLPSASTADVTKDFRVIGVESGTTYPINYSTRIQFASEDTTSYYTYILNNSSQKTIAEWQDTSINNRLRPNTQTPWIEFLTEDQYVLTIKQYIDGSDNIQKEKEIAFEVSALVGDMIKPNKPGSPIVISLPDGFYGKVCLIDITSGKILDCTQVYGENTATLGQTFTGYGTYQIVITSQDGSSISFYIMVDTRYTTVSLDTFQTTIYAPEVPVYVEFTKSVADYMRVYINDAWSEIVCPDYIYFPEYGTYTAKIYRNSTWQDAQIKITSVATSYKDICN